MKLLLLIALILTAVTGSAATLYGPIPYLSSADSPFNGVAFSYFHMENFEDGALNTPGASATVGAIVTGPGVFTDSVDADDGSIDGSGTAGFSMYSGNVLSAIDFTFSAAALGGILPTHVGIVWTDVGNTQTGALGTGPVLFEAFDASSVSLGVVGPFVLGDGSALGGTAEDRFFGAFNAGGISRIRLSMGNSIDWELDHLQYGAQNMFVPEPTSYMLLISGALLLLQGTRLRRSR